MKITILTPAPGEEDEVIIRCSALDDDLLRLLQRLKSGSHRITGYSESGITPLSLRDIYYFGSVDDKVFAYCQKQVYEVRKRLYELEAELSDTDFLRISKSVIVDLSKISHLSPSFNGRLEANLKNGEKIIISRQYVSALRQKLGI